MYKIKFEIIDIHKNMIKHTKQANSRNMITPKQQLDEWAMNFFNLELVFIKS